MAQLTKIETLQADTELVARKVDAAFIDGEVKKLLVDDLMPLMKSWGSAILELETELVATQDALDELADQEGDMINPELGARIVGTIFLAGEIIKLILDQEVKLPNDLADRKLRELIKEFERQALVTLKDVNDVIVNDDEEDGDFDEDDDTPVEIPKKKQEKKDGGNDDGNPDSEEEAPAQEEA